MSKRSKKLKGTGRPAAAPRRRMGGRLSAAALAACALLAVGIAATRFDPVRRAVGLRPLLTPGAQPQGGLPLAKEYVHAGGRLIATEEPAPVPSPTPAGAAPTNLRATAVSESGIRLTWDAPPGSVGSYVVERRGAPGAQPVEVPTGVSATSFDDTTPSGDFAYLYRVKAVFSGGGISPYSNSDLVTTIVFTDDPLVGAHDPAGRPATVIKATHLTELRRAVSAVHYLAGLGALNSWTHPEPVSAPSAQRRAVYLEDVKDLRDRLAEALPALGMTQPEYVDATLERRVTKVKKEHFQQLRDAVK